VMVGLRNAVFFMIRSLTTPQAAGNALAFAVQLDWPNA
jgi:hypothetical protein